MRRLSWRRLRTVAGVTLRRFPLVLLAALVAAVAATRLVEAQDTSPWLRVVLAAQLAIPTLLAAGLVAERLAARQQPPAVGVAIRAIAMAGLLGYGLSLPRLLPDADWLRFLQLNVAAHLAVAVAPFAGRGEGPRCWRFNLGLLLRTLTGVFFSLVLFAGLAVALGALDMLLGVPVDDDLYLQLLAVVAFVFNTAYVLGGIPLRLGDLDVRAFDPPVVRIFARSILAPLVAVYLAILVVYLVKIVVTSAWPSGWIGYLVSSVAVAGLLSLLLLRPQLADWHGRGRSRWVHVYARTFHVLMVPAVVMLALAVGKRIAQYRVTEPRYLLAVLTAWLAVVVVVGLVRRQPALRAIPASLAVLAVLTAIGPWSAAAVSRQSQLGRLDALMAETGRLSGATYVAATTQVDPERAAEISRLLDYLFGHFGTDALGRRAQPALQDALIAAVSATPARRPATRTLATTAAEFLGVPYRERWQGSSQTRHAFHRQGGEPGRASPVAGHDWLVGEIALGEQPQSFRVGQQAMQVTVDWPATRLVLASGSGDSLTVALAPWLARLREQSGGGPEAAVADSLLELRAAGPRLRLLLRAESVHWVDDEAGQPRSGMIRGALLLGASP